MPAFAGFQESDFRTHTRGVYWRHRRALGGELRKGLRQIYGRHYETWGVPGSNCMHIARRGAYRYPPRRDQAHLFVAASPQGLRWGLHVPGPGEHWQRFCSRLEHDPAALTTLIYLLSLYPLTLTDAGSEEGGVLGGCWRFEQDQLTWLEACTLPSASILNDIPFRLTSLPQDQPINLILYTQAPKEKVLAWGSSVAERLLPILLALVPLYEMI